MRVASTVWCTLVLMCVSMSLAACDASHDMARQVQGMTVPPESRASGVAGPQRQAQSVEFSWDVESNRAWDSYAEWVTARMSPSFRLAVREDDRLVFSQYRDGETHRVVVTLMQSAPFAHVRVTLVTSPD